MTTLFTVTMTDGTTHIVENLNQVTEPIVSLTWSIPKMGKKVHEYCAEIKDLPSGILDVKSKDEAHKEPILFIL